jgi:transcriptional regulator with XRE-family HTH domain
VASSEQVRSLRQRWGWTVEELADAVGASPLEAAAWEAGTVAVPAAQAMRIHWQARLAELAEAVAAAQERPCPWVRENAPDLYEQVFANPDRPWDAGDAPVRAHVAGCDRCKAVLEEARRIGGFPREPDTSGLLGARYRRWVDRLPRWARGPFSWAGLVASLCAIWLFFPFSGARSGPSIGVLFALIAWFSALIVLHRRTREPITTLLSGLAAGVGGLLGWAVGDPSLDLGDPRWWAVALAAGAVFGLLSLWQIRTVPGREAKAPAVDMEGEAFLRELDAVLPPRDPAVIRSLMDEWRAHHALGFGGAGPEPDSPPRAIPG